MVTPPNYPTLGKTELAYAAAAQLRDDYPDGQILLELAGASATPLSPAQALQQVIRAFRPEDTLPEEVPALQNLYRSTLGGRKVLILADDAHGAAQVRPLLPPAGCALLVTSRQRFTLDGMTPLDLERLEEGAAIALLRSICPRLTEDQAQQIARLCGHLPLALRVSAGILLNDPALTPKRYLARLKAQPLAELRDPDDPARDVGAILRLSYVTLEAPAQAVFRRLGMLTADADMALITALLELSDDQADGMLRSLLRRSLVEYDDVRQRWGMHDLVRACALELLAEAGEERMTRLRYAEQVIALIQEADWRYQAGGDGVLSGLALFDRERAHLEAVRLWLWAQPPAADIDALVIQEADATVFIGDLRDPLRTVRMPQLARALEVARRQGDRAAEGAVLGNLGLAYYSLGEVRRAIELYEQHLAIARELDDRAGEGRALGNLGFAWETLGDYPQAHRLYEDQLCIHREIGNRSGEGYALDALGTTFLLLGDAVQARCYCEAALGLAQEIGERSLEGTTLRDLANALTALDQLAEADASYVQSLAIHDELGNQIEAARTRWAYGQFLMAQGERERGLALLDACVAYKQRIGHAQAAEHAAVVEQLRTRST